MMKGMPHVSGGLNFFEAKSRALRSSRALILLFIAAVLLMMLLINGLIGSILFVLGMADAKWWLHHQYSWSAMLSVAILIIAGTAFEWLQLREGGRAIAKRLGARRIVAGASGQEEKRLLSVLDEVAIAAQYRPPVAYVLDQEAGINAFVAGYQPHDMVIILTSGALLNLDRQELQGVVGHEFSHMIHGDTQLSLRLMSVVGGLLMMSQLGRSLLDFGEWSHPSEPTRRFTLITLWFLKLIGGLLWVVGGVGVLLARLIKLAVLRQRELVADATSVQYTRSMGVLRALLRIRAHQQGSRLNALHAESISHFCFSSAMVSEGWFSTHPPLDDRIGALDPESLRRVLIRDRFEERTLKQQHTPLHSLAVLAETEIATQPLEWQPPKPLPKLRQMPVRAGREQHLEPLPLEQRRAMVRPDVIKRALSTKAGCRELLAAIMAVRQLTDCDPEQLHVSRALVEALARMDARVHIALFEHAIDGLGELPDSAARQLLHRLATIMQSDGRILLTDLLLLEWLKAKTHLLPDALPVVIESTAVEMSILVEALLQIQQLPSSQRVQVKQRALKSLWSDDQQHHYEQLTILQPIDLGRVLLTLAGLPRVHRLRLIHVAETCLWANLTMTQEEQDVLCLLRWRLGLSESVFSAQMEVLQLETPLQD